MTKKLVYTVLLGQSSNANADLGAETLTLRWTMLAGRLAVLAQSNKVGVHQSDVGVHQGRARVRQSSLKVRQSGVAVNLGVQFVSGSMIEGFVRHEIPALLAKPWNCWSC